MKSDSLHTERLVASRQGTSQHSQRLQWLLLLPEKQLFEKMSWQSSFSENGDTMLLKIKLSGSTVRADPSARARVHFCLFFL